MAVLFQYVHGNLSPECLATDLLLPPHILLDEGGSMVRFRLLYCVLACLFSLSTCEQHLTSTYKQQYLRGCRFYRPPEALVRNTRLQLSYSFDIFAAGVLMFEALTGDSFISESDGLLSLSFVWCV